MTNGKVISLTVLVLMLAPRVFGQGRTLTGLALDVDCAPLPGATVKVDGRDAIVTDARGRFELTGIEGTAITIHAELAGFARIDRTSEPWSGVRRQERLHLLVGPVAEVLPVVTSSQRVVFPGKPPEARYLRGQLRDENCRPLANATVRLPRDGDLTAVTDQQGRFSFQTITSGAHDVEVTATGFIQTLVHGYVFDENNSGAIIIAIDRGVPHEKATVWMR
jgi:Carboxypeptidase regulatory-like domain